MIAIIRLLAVLLGATAPEEPMSRLLALDEAAFARRVRARRRPDCVGHNVPDAGNGCTRVGVSAGPDRDFARDLVAAAPWLPASVRVNRAHGPRVLSCLTREYGIDQVIDLGCGLPHDDNRYLPDEVRRMVYVDSDPGVEAHARMTLAERHGTVSLPADLEDMPALLAAGPIVRLDHGRPIGVLLHDVLPWIGDETAHTALAALKVWLPPGSVLSLTHATTDTAPDAMASLTAHYAGVGILFRPRSGQQIRDLVRPWTALDEGGPVTTASWRRPALHPGFDHSHAYAFLASPGDHTP